MKPVYKIMFFFSLALFVASAVALAVFGLNFGVDFNGGSVLEISFTERPATEEITSVLGDTKIEALKDLTVTPSGQSVIIKTGELNEQEHQNILSALKGKFPNAGVQEKRFDSVGPAVGRELRNKSLVAIVIVLAAIMGYITIAFRKLSGALSLWAMNFSALVGLLHDIVIPMGIFAVLGYYYNVQISAVFVAAILTILGYTVSDKVVIFDRVRENIVRGGKGNLADIVHKSVMQTLVRSINNTLTVLLSSLAIYLFGGESIRYFALALILGIALGAYSSIFVASPLLVWWSKRA
jgi:preprotein translocase subunit SecF